MDEQRVRVLDDLKGLVTGELLFRELERVPYRSDGGLIQIDPLGVVLPKIESDLVALVRYATDQGLSLHPRGAGTGRRGGCIGPGLIVDFSRHFRRLTCLTPDRVVAQSGVTMGRVNRGLATYGRRLAMAAPAGAETHTLGGLLALDEPGFRLSSGLSARNAIESIRVILSDGEAGELYPPEDRRGEEHLSGFDSGLRRRLRTLVDHATGSTAGATRWEGRPGYDFDALTSTPGLNLYGPLVGSEGTLALFTELSLRTEPIPGVTLAAVLPFPSLLAACDAVPECLEAGPSACEVLDRRTLMLAADAVTRLRAFLSPWAEAAVVVGFEGHAPGPVEDRWSSLLKRISRARALCDEPAVTRRRPETDRLIDLAEVAAEQAMRLRGPSRPVGIVERLRIDPRSLSALVSRLVEPMRARGLGFTLHAHAAVAEVNLRPFLDLADPATREALPSLAAEMREIALELGGTVSAGLGDDRIPTLRRQQGDRYNANRELKFAFDPVNVLNPGRLSGDEAKPLPIEPRRLTSPGQDALIILSDAASPSPLRWEDRAQAEHLAACNRCGACRTEAPGMRICPIFRASHLEHASPRSKVSLLQQIAAGQVDPAEWTSEELKYYADLCVHCKLCETECPAKVDVSSLMLDVKMQYVSQHGLPPEDWLRSRVDSWAGWASRFPLLFNGLMGNRAVRWVLDRAFGLSRHRRLPRAHRRSFLRRAERLGLTRARPQEAGPRAAFFLDIVANHFDQELAETSVALLQHAGVNVYVPRTQVGCGMPALVAGDFPRARDLVESNLKALGNAVRDGYTIVCSEPTAALMLRSEAARLTGDLDAPLVAENTMDLGQYLKGLESRGLLCRPDVPVPIRAAYHQPCHLKALGVGTPGLDLLRMIPGLDVEFVDRGCSGMAGTYGLGSRNFRTSLRAGRALLKRLRDRDFRVATSECSTCRMQMEHAMPGRTVHPVKLLALGYGLNPNLRRVLDASPGESSRR